jgi:ribosomal protein S6
MTDHNHKYQAMFLLDNEEVRQGFNAARDWVRTTLEKHGLKVHVLRLWGERQLAYPIGGRRRATYLLGWLEGSGDAVNNARRELYLLGPVFRCMFLEQGEIPAEEMSQGIPEMADADLIIPEEIEDDLAEEMREGSEQEEEASSEESEEEGKEEAKESSSEEGEAKADSEEEKKETATTGGTSNGN